MGKEKEPGKKGRGGRRAKRLLLLLLLCAVLGVAWGYLQPLLTADAVTTYDSYTARTGTVSTDMSFNATISVLHSETLTNSETATVSKIDVKEGAEVKAGDKIIELSTGDVLKATMDGTVNEIAVSEGDWLWRANRPLAQICDLTHLQVALTVDEYDIRKVQVGQPCTVSIISLGMDFVTEVAHVNYVSSATGTLAYYSVSAELTVPENVLPGMVATVTIPAQTAENATVLDMAALSFREDGTPYVLLKAQDGTYREQDVTTGLSDGMTVEVTSGIASGDEVWVATGTESSGSGFTLSGLYKQIFGETVVINEEAAARGAGRGSSDAAAQTEQLPTEAADTTADMMPPDTLGTATDMTRPEGKTRPEGMTRPDMATATDMTSPEGGTMPEGMTRPQRDSGEQPTEKQSEQGGDGE